MVASLPPWADVFPCLAEIYMASDRTSPANWFRQPNVWRGLLASDANLQPLERDLQLLDPASWALFTESRIIQ